MQTTVRGRFDEALESLVAKLKQDRTIIAAILFGSMSYDEVWDKSDIDLILIGQEDRKTSRSYCLVENDVNIHAGLYPRSLFKQMIEGQLQSSFWHSSFARSTLLFSKDDTIKDYYRDAYHLGARDREMQLMNTVGGLFASLAKAEKWLYVKKDLNYSFVWIMYCVNSLAQIEVLWNGEVTGREVIQQALKYNPDFFNAVYTDLINRNKEEADIRRALHLINGYLDERAKQMLRPILDYLAEAGGVRSTSEIDLYFKERSQSSSQALAYEWLADKGIIRKVPAPLRLTEKSNVAVDEAAYYYDGGQND